jgi:DNA-binding CsgD family transcriptional regulator
VAAADCLSLARLSALFAAALAAEGVDGHLCCAIDAAGDPVPLFGDSWALAGAGDAAALPFESAAGEALAMYLTPAAALTDRAARARVRLLCVVAAAAGVPLLEAEDAEDAGARHPTSVERTCLGLTLAGWDRIDIADRLMRSPEAVGVHLRRAAARLGVDTVAEAVALASRRGLISDE